MTNFRKVSAEVYHAAEDVVTFGKDDMQTLKTKALETARRRARFCAHSDPTVALQEMLIVHPRDTYIRPHMHLGKAESLLVIEGELLLVLFDRDGHPVKWLNMAAPSNGRPFFVRIPEETFHTLLIKTEWLTFLEVTTGPFDRKQMVFAPWAPRDDEVEAAQVYCRHILQQAESAGANG